MNIFEMQNTVVKSEYYGRKNSYTLFERINFQGLFTGGPPTWGVLYEISPKIVIIF